jgi:putative DNA methylase
MSDNQKSDRPYPKRLIEVDLPIKEISAHARREKSIRHGHISTLHIWWARRPLAACRAVICAALWPDPADDLCPPKFREDLTEIVMDFAKKVREDKRLMALSKKGWSHWNRLSQGAWRPENPACWFDMRYALLEFIADFANWDASTVPEFLETSRKLTQSAHEAMGGIPGTKPLIVDPFAGGGSIPLEALRVGADAFASDLNPVAVLLNKVVLEYIPRHGKKLAEEVQKWGQWIKEEAEKELAEFYPKDPDGAKPIAYLWARTIRCEGPNCGIELPLLRSLWLAKKGEKSSALRLKFISKNENKSARSMDSVPCIIDFDILQNMKEKDVAPGTVRRASATCPYCGYTTPSSSVRRQLKNKKGGALDARLVVIRQDNPKTGKREYRIPNDQDHQAIINAITALEHRRNMYEGPLCLTPDEGLPIMSGVFNAPIYGHDTWGSLFSPRQALSLSTFMLILEKARIKISAVTDSSLAKAVITCLALGLDRLADFNSSLCVLNVVGGRGVVHTFGRQALPMVWDFMETNPLNDVGANWDAAVEAFRLTIELESTSRYQKSGQIELASAIAHPLPDDSCVCFFTDPPYYNAVPYADLSDFFYVWLKRTIGPQYHELFKTPLAPKDEEICEMAGWDPARYPHKNSKWFEMHMTSAMLEGRRILTHNGIGIIVFAHKSTSGWESQIQALIEAGWIITGSWPIDTERPGRLRAQDSAALASSIHLVVRPREESKGMKMVDEIGDWRDIRNELPVRIHSWMPRLAREGVVGADAIFACLGPALEVFSRYSSVEKATGAKVTLKEYLEEVWAAVSHEALKMIFEGGDVTGFEEDARLTAMWLWTLSTGNGSENNGCDGKAVSYSGYTLEYDAARKVAQGLGAHLEKLSSLVEIKGDTARLLPVSERTQYLFAKEQSQTPRKSAKKSQMELFPDLEELESESGWGVKTAPPAGKTILDRVHQSMILFASGRSEAMKRFLVEDGAGKDTRFWSLAQALSALYPSDSEEKRWIDGVLARKKGLGF